jgi:divalent metal cation (Fe/Co/Zn/Cd) transporter
VGLAVNGVAGCINAGWSWLLIRRGRQLRSPALVADGRHLFTDVISSIGVLGGVGIAAISGWSVLDPALAAAVMLLATLSGSTDTRSDVTRIGAADKNGARIAALRLSFDLSGPVSAKSGPN